MERRRRWSLANWFGLAVSIAALVWLGQAYDFKELRDSLASARYGYLVPAVLLVLIDYLLRAVRWRALFVHNRPKSLGVVFRALMVGYLFNVLLPARAGELVRIQRLGTDEGISRSAVLGTVAVERIGDLLVLIGMLGLVLLAYPALPPWLKNAGFAVMPAALCGAGILVAFRFGGQRFAAAVMRMSRLVLPAGWFERVERSMQYFVLGIESFFVWKAVFVFLLLTGILWLLETAILHSVAAAFAMQIAPGNLLFVLLVIAIGTMVPSSPGFIGTFEFFGVTALNLVGVAGPAALSLIVILHALTLLVPSIIGSLCLLGWGGSNRQTAAGQGPH